MIDIDQERRRAAVLDTIDEIAAMVSEDGAAVTVVAIEPDGRRVELDLTLDDLECEDCVLPPDRLHATIAASLVRATGEAIDVVLHDPRTATPVGRRGAASPVVSYVVLDPTGTAPDDGIADPGPDAGPLRGKTVAIRHDVLWPAFDWTIEEWTRLLEQAGVTVLTWPRAQGEKDEDLRRADAELEAMLARADVAISGLANCGSCTSWSVRDAIIARSRGLPTTVVATAHFESLAHLLAAEGGRPGLRVTVLPYPYSTLDEQTVRAHARAEFAQLIDVLGAAV
jgi:hypothetical protein